MSEPQISRPLTPDEEFYLEWGRDTHKASISASADALQRLISLNGTMLGGSLVLWQTTSYCPWLRQLCCALFLLALLAAFWGIFPESANVDLDNPDDIKAFKLKVLTRRKKYLRVASILTILAFSTAFWGLIQGAPKKEDAKKTDAGNGSNGICRVIDAFRSPSPDPRR